MSAVCIVDQTQASIGQRNGRGGILAKHVESYRHSERLYCEFKDISLKDGMFYLFFTSGEMSVLRSNLVLGP